MASPWGWTILGEAAAHAVAVTNVAPRDPDPQAAPRRGELAAGNASGVGLASTYVHDVTYPGRLLTDVVAAAPPWPPVPPGDWRRGPMPPASAAPAVPGQ